MRTPPPAAMKRDDVPLTNRERKYVEGLEKRLHHLAHRIATAKSDLSFDKAGASALKWVLGKVAEKMTEDKAIIRRQDRRDSSTRARASTSPTSTRPS